MVISCQHGTYFPQWDPARAWILNDPKGPCIQGLGASLWCSWGVIEPLGYGAHGGS
jgi:hypothetical protein